MSRWAKLVRRLRTNAGMSYRDLATLCGVSATTIFRLEHCDGQPTVETLESILGVFGYALQETQK